MEIVDLVNPRNRRNKNKSVDDDTESRYAGRKNFKKFKKNKSYHQITIIIIEEELGYILLKII